MNRRLRAKLNYQKDVFLCDLRDFLADPTEEKNLKLAEGICDLLGITKSIVYDVNPLGLKNEPNLINKDTGEASGCASATARDKNNK